MSTPAQKELNRLNKKAAYERLHSVNPDQADVVSKFGGTSYPISLVMRSYGISNFEADGQNVARKTFFEMEIGGPGSSRFSINKELLAKPLPFMGYAETDDGEIDRGVILAYRESDKTYSSILMMKRKSYILHITLQCMKTSPLILTYLSR